MNHDKFEKNFQICRYPRGNELEASGKAVLACLSNTNVISSSSEVLYETDAVYAAKCPDDFMDIPPATIEESTFSNRANATLYVPTGSKTVYQSANYWKEFKEIKESNNLSSG